jgi:hypothetical protein
MQPSLTIRFRWPELHDGMAREAKARSKLSELYVLTFNIEMLWPSPNTRSISRWTTSSLEIGSLIVGPIDKTSRTVRLV